MADDLIGNGCGIEEHDQNMRVVYLLDLGRKG